MRQQQTFRGFIFILLMLILIATAVRLPVSYTHLDVYKRQVLPSLSRLMKDGIGEGYTRADHQDVANQLFSCYAKVGDARALASVIGEDELSPTDKKYLVFGREFEENFVGQERHENRTVLETLDIGWRLLGMLPREELDRIDTKILDQFYKPAIE